MNALQFQKKLLSMQENMMNFALMLTANRDDAQDLMQDTTLKVLDNQEKFVDNINFKGWVLTVMRNIPKTSLTSTSASFVRTLMTKERFLMKVLIFTMILKMSI